MLHPDAEHQGYRLQRHASIGSTNEDALARARAGDPGRLWIVADHQSQGRGRVGRAWASPPGNLYASLLLIDPCDMRLAPQLGFVAGVALVQALEIVAGPSAGFCLKWPNDVLVRGAKLAGLLVEASTTPPIGLRPGTFSVVLGFGVNCASHPTDLPYSATHLGLVAGAAGTRAALFTALSAMMPHALSLWARGANFTGIRRVWLDHALPQGSRLVVVRSGTTHEGLFKTVDHDGKLVLETHSGCITVEAGDVFLADHDMTAAS